MPSNVYERARVQLSAMPLARVTWMPAVRIVPYFPPIEQLEGFDPTLQAAIIAELAMVDPQIIGNLRLLPAGDMPAGRGASRLITSYTFSQPGRFNDETFSAFYGADSIETAIAETIHHIIVALRDSGAPAQTLPPRLVIQVDVDAQRVVDTRLATYPEIFDPNAYAESQSFGTFAHQRGDDGIVYRSVRRSAGECVAIYSLASLHGYRNERELTYRYLNGQIEVSEVLHRTAG